jgi:hypothetical protein
VAGDAATAEQFRDFVLTLVAAKERDAGAIFVANPFDEANGLMRSNGMPAEALLPWRTTAAMLGGAKFLGRLQLPAGSDNRVFQRPDGLLVMVVWSDAPTQESDYFGKEVRQYNLVGLARAPAVEDGRQIIEVNRLPTFVLGLHDAITRIRITLDFEQMQVPSVFAKPHANALRLQNSFLQGIGGSLTIVVPKDHHDERAAADSADAAAIATDRWTIEPARRTVRLAAGEDARFPFEIRLKDAMFGRQPVRVDFDLEADEHYQFSVYRNMEVGTGDLTLDVRSHLTEDGSLIVEQFMTNLAPGLADFKCYLYGGERRQRMQVYRLGPNVDRKVYRYPNGAELVGKELRLEIEELNGERVLRYRFKATATSDPHPSQLPADKPPADASRPSMVKGLPRAAST